MRLGLVNQDANLRFLPTLGGESAIFHQTQPQKSHPFNKDQLQLTSEMALGVPVGDGVVPPLLGAALLGGRRRVGRLSLHHLLLPPFLGECPLHHGRLKIDSENRFIQTIFILIIYHQS